MSGFFINLFLKNTEFIDKIGMILKMKEGIIIAGTKFSRQRQCIIEYLRGTKEHPTAEMVYLHVRKEYPNISLGTVYRNLKLLAAQGQIKRLYCGDGCERFDSDISEHNHFICRHCNNVMDLDMELFNHINTLAQVCFPGKIEGHVTYFYGICQKCFNTVDTERSDVVESEERNE